MPFNTTEISVVCGIPVRLARARSERRGRGHVNGRSHLGLALAGYPEEGKKKTKEKTGEKKT